MTTLLATVTSKGQITLPKQIRDTLSIRAGDQLEFALGESHTLSLRKMREAGSSSGCAKGFVKPGGVPLSDEQVKKALRNRMKRKYALGFDGV